MPHLIGYMKEREREREFIEVKNKNQVMSGSYSRNDTTFPFKG